MNLSELDSVVDNFANHGHAPTLAIVPPIMRVFVTFDIPHPSSGVSKRPFKDFDDMD